jgi:hypothetical protein
MKQSRADVICRRARPDIPFPPRCSDIASPPSTDCPALWSVTHWAGSPEVNEYRAYIKGPDGRVLRRVDLLCADYDAARDRAKLLVDGHDVELWQLSRRIAEFKHEE